MKTTLRLLPLLPSSVLLVAGCGSDDGNGQTGGVNSLTNPSNGDASESNGGSGDTGGPVSDSMSGGPGNTNASGADSTTGTDPSAGTEGGGDATMGDPSESGGEPACDAPIPDIIPIDETGWVAESCNEFGVQGAWYCYDDGVAETDCSPPPWDAANSGMCISGTLATGDDTYGAAVGLSLSETGGDASVKSAYDASAHGVIGFEVEIAGDTGGNPIRIGFTGSASPGVSPFVAVQGAGTHQVMLEDALIPEEWDVPEGTSRFVDPTAIYDLFFQVANDDATAFDFCVTRLTPITDGSGGGPALPEHGQALCGGPGSGLADVGHVAVQNNTWGPVASNAHCTQPLWDNSPDRAGFRVTPGPGTLIDVAGPDGPGSYPSLVYGWHYGGYHGGMSSARQLSSITSIPTTWSYDVPGGMNRYNVAYDLWLNSSGGNPASSAGMLELMVWTATRDAVPIGDPSTNPIASVEIAGAAWEVWYGPNANGWNTLSYRRTSNVSTVELDIMDFIEDALTRSEVGISENWYLLGVQAGFEIWEQHDPMTTNSFSVSMQ